MSFEIRKLVEAETGAKPDEISGIVDKIQLLESEMQADNPGSTEKLGGEESGTEALLGLVRHRLSRLSGLWVLVASAGLAVGVGNSMSKQEYPEETVYQAVDLPELPQPEPKIPKVPENEIPKQVQYGSPDYHRLLNIIREDLRKNGVLQYPETKAEHDGFLRVREARREETILLHDAIYEQNIQEDETQIAAYESKRLAEKAEAYKQETRMPAERFNGILERMKYESILQESAERFGIIPYRRIGYQRYDLFNLDVIAAVDKVNKRLENINEKGKHRRYGPLSYGLMAAVALQEGFAFTISAHGYDPEYRFNTYTSLGLDSLYDDIDLLRAASLVDPDFKAKIEPKIESIRLWDEVFNIPRRKISIANEAGLKLTSAFGKAVDLMEGMAALLVHKRNYVIDAVGEETWNSFGQEEQDWLTYAAYQWGQGNVVRLILKGEIVDQKGKVTHITNYPKYKDGTNMGNVSDLNDFIYRNSGKRLSVVSLSDFHNTACQVAAFARVSNTFFEARNLQP